MTPPEEQPTPVETAPPESAPAAPESRPEAAEESPAFPRALFDSMLEQTQTRPLADAIDEETPAPKESRESREPREPRESREVRAPRESRRPEAPAAPAGRYAGKYDTPEALETGYRELERARERAEGEKGRAVESAQRLERLLTSALQGKPLEPPAAAPPVRAPVPAPMDLPAAVLALREEHEKIGLGDPEGDPLRFARALAVVLSQDETARQSYVGPALRELQRETSERNELEKLKTDFFAQHPDLRSIRLDRLRSVAVETEAQLRQARPELEGEAFVKEWFDLTAREARATYRTEPGPNAPAPTGRAAGARPRPDSPRATGAPFAESPSPRASEPALTGQAYHLARVFGRGA